MAMAVSAFAVNSPCLASASSTTSTPCLLFEVKNFGSDPLSSRSLLTKRASRSSSIGLVVKSTKSYRNGIRAFFFNPAKEPIVREALKEPITFLGGMFAGLLRLDLEEEPLKEWVTRTVEVGGISEEDINVEGSTTENLLNRLKLNDRYYDFDVLYTSKDCLFGECAKFCHANKTSFIFMVQLIDKSQNISEV